MDPNNMTPRRVRLEDIMRPAVSVTPDTPARAVLGGTVGEQDTGGGSS